MAFFKEIVQHCGYAYLQQSLDSDMNAAVVSSPCA